MIRKRESLRKVGKLGIARIPHLDSIGVRVNDILKMRRQGCAVDGWTSACDAYALGDVEDDACEAIFVEIHLLVIWNLPNSAGNVS